MKKIINMFFIFLVFLTLSGCGFFGGSEKVISNITTEEKDALKFIVNESDKNYTGRVR